MGIPLLQTLTNPCKNRANKGAYNNQRKNSPIHIFAVFLTGLKNNSKGNIGETIIKNQIYS
jgi:hypothetical protein